MWAAWDHELRGVVVREGPEQVEFLVDEDSQHPSAGKVRCLPKYELRTIKKRGA